MIGLDTNILLRAVLKDDAVQSPLAVDFLSRLTADAPGLIDDIALAEFVWTLERTADYKRGEIARALRAMLNSRSYCFLNRGIVSKALTRFEAEKKIGFADALIGEVNLAAGCSTTFTFDAGAAKTDLFSLVRP